MAYESDDVRLHVAIEFARFVPSPYDRLVDRLWLRKQYADRNWADFGLWWRKTAAGRAYAKAYPRRRRAVLQSVQAEVRWCVACKREFVANAYQVQRRHGRVCSPECRGRARKNIELIAYAGQRKTLSAWCADLGVKVGTAWARMKRGWSFAEAVGLSTRGRSGGVVP